MKIIKKGYALDLIEFLTKYRRKKSSVVATELSLDGSESELHPKHLEYACNSSRLRARAQ